MLPDEVRKAMERAALMAGRDGDWVEIDDADWQTIRAHLLAREAEVERLNAWIIDYHKETRAAFLRDQARAERTEALLRECLAVMELYPATHTRITAHLSENSRG